MVLGIFIWKPCEKLVNKGNFMLICPSQVMRIHGYLAWNYHVLMVFAGVNHISVSAELKFIIGSERLLSLSHKKVNGQTTEFFCCRIEVASSKYEAHYCLICVCPDFVWSIFIFKWLLYSCHVCRKKENNSLL